MIMLSVNLCTHILTSILFGLNYPFHINESAVNVKSTTVKSTQTVSLVSLVEER